MPAKALVSNVMFGCVHAPVAVVGAARNASTSAVAPALPSAETVCFGATAPSITIPTAVVGTTACTASRTDETVVAYWAAVAAVGAGPIVRYARFESCCASDAAYCANEGVTGVSASSSSSRGAGVAARLATTAGSGVVAPSGQLTVARLATTSGDTPVSSSLDGLTGVNGPEPTRTIGGASIANVWPFQSVAVMCTGYTPARFGCHVKVCQPPSSGRRLVGPAAVTATTVAGFDNQNRT